MTARRTLLKFAATLAIAAFVPALPASAAEVVSTDGTIKISGSWTRATPGGAKVAGGYVKITNTGAVADRLIGGTLVTAGKVEIHEMAMTDGVMKMGELAQGLEIKPGETVELKPGGYHIMFMELAAPVKEGDKLDGTLVFQRAGTLKVQFSAAAIGAKSEGVKNDAAASHGHIKH